MLHIDLSKRVAVITGGSGKLGPAIARALAECGAAVAVHYHTNAEKAEDLCRELSGNGHRALAVQADITNLESIQLMRDKITAELGSADIIINNAVSPMTWLPVLESKKENYEAMFGSCVLQNVLMAQAFVPAMRQKNHGRIIAVNTECSMQNGPGMSAYTSGKRGMDGVLRVLAREVGEHQITVNQVAPGWTISDQDRINHTEKQEGYEMGVPLRRRGEDSEIANVIAFLASDLASFITGAYIPVCGGTVMPGI